MLKLTVYPTTEFLQNFKRSGLIYRSRKEIGDDIDWVIRNDIDSDPDRDHSSTYDDVIRMMEVSDDIESFVFAEVDSWELTRFIRKANRIHSILMRYAEK